MEEQFVPYEQALELKKLGFDEGCIAFYFGSKKPYLCSVMQPRSKDINVMKNSQVVLSLGCTAPLWQQAFDWFRDKYGLIGEVQSTFHGENFNWHIRLRPAIFIKDGDFNTYEEARLGCLKKLIKIITHEN